MAAPSNSVTFGFAVNKNELTVSQAAADIEERFAMASGGLFTLKLQLKTLNAG